METISGLIQYEFAAITTVLYVLGRVICGVERIPNRWVPLILTVTGIGLALLSADSRIDSYRNVASMVYDGVVQGVLCTGMAVYVHEVAKQTTSRKSSGADK
jgi:hypothetical protein